MVEDAEQKQISMAVSKEDFKKLEELIENPIEPNEKLKMLMHENSPWEDSRNIRIELNNGK